MVGITLEGRVAGAWVEELSQTWRNTAPILNGRTLSIDLRNVTYCDAKGKELLQQIYAQTSANLLAGTPWAQYLAEEISRTKGPNTGKEAGNGQQYA